MWHYPWMFWLVPLLFFFATRRRRWSRWAPPDRDVRLEMGKRLEDQASFVDALESRVAQLEERLDFTERLLAGRSAPPGTA
ncbi:MAG TPA: hypothetical protein VHR41_16265 [Gemmatimonadales bacterium]|jgi:hypothetical protein|nr:hypothetical protein [Gemmatimonadales bacterium]